MDIRIEALADSERRAKPTDETKLGFGKIYSDHMFSMHWTPDSGWTDARVHGYGPMQMEPASLVLHYGQTIFEGLKAYRNQHGTINLFRPEKNLERFNRSARRLDLPEMDEAVWMRAIEALLELDHEWVPTSQGTSLYIRPTMIAVEPYIGLKSTSKALMFIITGPVGAYYPEGFNPVKIVVCEEYSRAGRGGLGNAKTAANYAASLRAEKDAQQAGFTQVLWLDSAERRYVEEVGSMNIFFRINGKVVTPPLSGTILEGVTRDSVITLLRHWGEPVEERPISIEEVTEAQASGALEEVFGSGTAAVISPVGMLRYKGQDLAIANGETGPVARRLFDELTAIQYGRAADPFGWIREVNPHQKAVTAQPVARVAV